VYLAALQFVGCVIRSGSFVCIFLSHSSSPVDFAFNIRALCSSGNPSRRKIPSLKEANPRTGWSHPTWLEENARPHFAWRSQNCLAA
jgi:hypothetical protein